MVLLGAGWFLMSEVSLYQRESRPSTIKHIDGHYERETLVYYGSKPGWPPCIPFREHLAILNLRITTSQRCESVPRRARI